ncbi:Dabb family protein [Vogesella sp. LIG4]|uniref:Dabb family protein n=1 Tax=Vogesella sp. LIG4 TaxID=1192162 RepID=UPI00081FDE43|nr:Dabb family protein [Vogesella sp. LIG4]SCK13725.1 Stress responsive A/B Barrel Domain [Vogesella sp. LIG4]
MLHHIVLFRFPDHTDADTIARVQAEFAALVAATGVVSDFRHGPDVSPEGLAQGFTHGWLLQFAGVAERDAYLVHPAHQQFVAMVQPLLAAALVFDFVD